MWKARLPKRTPKSVKLTRAASAEPVLVFQHASASASSAHELHSGTQREIVNPGPGLDSSGGKAKKLPFPQGCKENTVADGGFGRVASTFGAAASTASTFGRVSSAAGKWKDKGPMTDVELESLLEDDTKEAEMFEGALDSMIRSKDSSSLTLEYVMKLPPSLPLFVSEVSSPHAIIVANKKWREMTQQRDPVGKTLAILDGIDSDKCAASKIFGHKEETLARLWHYTVDETPFIHHLTVFPLCMIGDDNTTHITHYLGVSRRQLLSDEASKAGLSQLRQMLMHAGLLGIVSKQDEYNGSLMYTGRMPSMKPLNSSNHHHRAQPDTLQSPERPSARADKMQVAQQDTEFSKCVDRMNSHHLVYETIQRRRSTPIDVSVHVKTSEHQAAQIQEVEALARKYSHPSANKANHKHDSPGGEHKQLLEVSADSQQGIAHSNQSEKLSTEAVRNAINAFLRDPPHSNPSRQDISSKASSNGILQGMQAAGHGDSWDEKFSRAKSAGCIKARAVASELRVLRHFRKVKTPQYRTMTLNPFNPSYFVKALFL
jgi:hypothetical protein